TSTGRNRVDFNDWMRDVERRMTSQERRPQHVHGLQGPGIGPRATKITDWNDDKVVFNGYFYSDVGSLHSPDPLKAWIGYAVANLDGWGLQQVTSINLSTDVPGTSFQRGFVTPTGSTRVYSTWTAI